MQTPDGYLWLGTEFGLLRFDGVRFEAWQPPLGQTLPSPVVLKLVAASDGSLWIATTQGLARWFRDTLTVFPELAQQRVVALTEGQHATIWVGTSVGFNQAAVLCAVHGTSATCDAAGGTLGQFVSTVLDDGRGNLWVGAATGLWSWTEPRHRYVLPAAQPEIHAMVNVDGQQLLVAINRSVASVQGGGVSTLPIPGTDAQFKPTVLLRDRDGGLWIGTQDQGLVHMYNGHADRFAHADGLSGDFVQALFEDREGDVWVATENGLDRFRALPVTTLSQRQGLSTDNVQSVLADRTGHVWIGTTEGLDVLEGSRIRVDDAWTAATQDVATGTLFEDDRGQVWASSFQGLAYARDGVFTFADSVPGGHIQAIAEDAAHNVWVSHQEHGLLRLRDNRVVQVIPWDRFGGKVARVIAADPLDGGVWLGFYEGGVSYFKNGAVRSAYVSIDGAPIGTVTSLYLDQHQTLWAATQRGLLRLDGKTLTLVTTREGLPCNVVHWATQDPSGTMWVDTACGLARFPTPPHASSSSDAAAMEPMVFDASDGTPSRAAVGGYGPKVTTGPDGRVWFANNDGVGVIDPNHLALNRVMPPVHIERIVADHTTYDTAHDLELASSVRDIRIDYSALSLVDPDRVRFRYKLEGRDRDWIDAGNRRQAFYTDLPPGNYRFRVIAANNNGLWNMEGDSQALSILPAFYQRTSFRIACGILLVALAWSLHHARLRRITERLNVRFDDRLTERTRIAQDLHDTLLQDFLSVSMQLHVIADQLDGHRSKARFDVLLSRLRDIVETGRRTVQGLQTGDRDHRELADALVKDAESLRGHQSVEICVTIEGDRRPLSSIVSDDVYCIGREAIANVFRHAGATRLSLFLNYTSGSFQLKVVDDGRGMEADVLERSLEGHWGIYGMRQRAERGGGRVRIWTRPKAGTEVELTVPAQIAYTPADSNAKRDGAARG